MREFLSERNKKILIFAGVLIIVLALPLTLYLVNQQQEQRGRAAEPDKLEAEDGVLSADGVEIQSGTLAPGGEYVGFVEVTPPPPDLTLTPTPTPGPISAFAEANGRVVMQAEHHDGKSRGTADTHRWDGPRTIVADYTKEGYMSALPDDGITYFADGHKKGPVMVYNINFTTPGTYYVYLRSSGPGGNGDSAHVTMDDSLPQSMDLYHEGEGGGTTPWEWRGKNNDGSDTKFEITNSGIHYFRIYMREDGTRVDKIHLTKEQGWKPFNGLGASGPAESLRVTF